MPKSTELNLLAALIATNGGKADCRGMAAVLGVTYDTVETRMRTVKKQAHALLADAKSQGRVDESGKPLVEIKATPKKRKIKDEEGDIETDSKPKKKKAAKDDDDNVRFKEESD